MTDRFTREGRVQQELSLISALESGGAVGSEKQMRREANASVQIVRQKRLRRKRRARIYGASNGKGRDCLGARCSSLPRLLQRFENASDPGSCDRKPLVRIRQLELVTGMDRLNERYLGLLPLLC
jgi:hypothetical protein